MKHHVLLVEDEENIRKFTRLNLEREGFEVSEAETGELGVEKALAEKPDVAVLDVMLPGIDGYEVCSILQKEAADIGIIMLTAKTQADDRILGLEKGADDYLAKPFNPKELALRIKSLIRRLGKDTKSHDGIIEVPPFRIDLKSKTSYKNDQELVLTPTEFSILTLFMKNPGRAYTRAELLELSWGENYDGADKTVDVNIRRLRSKIEDNPSKPQYIETVWGTGYRWKQK